MVEKVTAGATGSMGNITGMSSFDATYLTGMMEKVTAGATGALGNITMADYDATDLSGMMEKVTAGATGALGNIVMAGYTSDNLSSMVSNITSGATGALGNISMDGYSSDNLTAFTSTITTSVTGSLSNITMDGYNANTDNLSSSVTSGASSAGLVFFGSDNVTGTFSSMYNGGTPSDGCIGSGAVSLYQTILPTGTSSFKIQKTFTSSTSFTEKFSYYSDSSCSTSTGYIKFGFTNLIVNPASVTVSALSPRPGTAYRIQYSRLNVISKGETSGAVSFLNTFLGRTHSLNVEQTNPSSGTIYNIAATGTAGSLTLLFIGSPLSSSTYPTGWTNSDEVAYK